MVPATGGDPCTAHTRDASRAGNAEEESFNLIDPYSYPSVTFEFPLNTALESLVEFFDGMKGSERVCGGTAIRW